MYRCHLDVERYRKKLGCTKEFVKFIGRVSVLFGGCEL